jgi:hypothetical protein
MNIAIETKKITKRYRDVLAVSDLSLRLVFRQMSDA